MKCKVFFSLICCYFIGTVRAQNSFYISSDSLNKHRLMGVSIGQGIAFGSGSVGLYSLWYSKKNMSKFHLFNDWNNWNNMDKAGHIYSSYHFSKMSTNLFYWSGLNNKKSLFIGCAIGLGFQSFIEIMDGFSSSWGFSIGDMGANIIGSSLFASQELLFNKQIITPKFSYHPTPYPSLRPEVLGNNHVQRLFKDYNGQTYWLSISPASLMKSCALPKWLCFSFGYSIDKRIYGDANIATVQNNEYLSSKEYLFSLDIDFSKIKCKNNLLKIILNQLNYLKIPFSTISFSNNKLNFHPIYF